jgi:lipopolysaccharide transport system permease protein
MTTTTTTSAIDGGFELRPGATSPLALLRSLWASRDLVGILARKDFYVRYRRASFGMFWAVGLPLVQAAVMAVVFTRVLGARVAGNGNYAAFLVTGMVVWSFISAVVGSASTAIVDGASLSNRIYFPRMILPITAVAASLYSFLISIVVALGVDLLFGVRFGPELALLVPAIALVTALAAVVAMLTSALHVYFRDIRYIVAAAIQPGFYVTPVLYPLSFAATLPRPVETLIRLNPATGVVELFRAATVGADHGWPGLVAVSCAWVVGLGVVSLALHSRFDRVFSDRM